MRQSVLTKCTRYVHLSEFFRLYTKSHKEATRNGSSVQQELKSRNLIPEKGRSWKNVYIDFLLSSFYTVPISEVKTDRKLRNQLRMEVRLAQHIYLLEEHFGQGIFALLPDECISL